MLMMNEQDRGWRDNLGHWLRRLLITATAAMAIGIPLSTVSALPLRPHCDQCRRFTDTSPARFQAYVPVKQRMKVVDACSLFCLYELLEDYDEEPAWVFATNYATVGDKEALPQRANLMYYVFDCSEGDDEKTCPPYTYAFATEAEAAEFVAEHDGELLSWEDVVAQTIELTAEWEPEAEYERRSSAPYRKRSR